MVNKQWQGTVGNIISGIWMYTLGGIAAGLVGLIGAVIEPLRRYLFFFSSGDTSAFEQFVDAIDSFELLFKMTVIIGYYFFFSSIVNFGKLQKADEDKAAVNKIKTSYIFLIIAILLAYVPLVGPLLRLIFVIISYVKLFSGYGALKRSSTQLPEACKGASTLYTATIISLIGAVLGCIPLLGDFIEGIFTFIAFFMVLSGWNAIRRGAPEMTEEEVAFHIQEEKSRVAKLPNPVIQGYFLLVLAGASVFFLFLHLCVQYSGVEADRDIYSTINLVVFAFNTVLYVFMICYKKANVKGFYLFPMCFLAVFTVCECYIHCFGPSWLDDLSPEVIKNIPMIESMVYTLAMALFIMPGRMSVSLKLLKLLTMNTLFWKIVNVCGILMLEGTDYKARNVFITCVYFVIFILTAILVRHSNQTIAKQEQELNSLPTT